MCQPLPGGVFDFSRQVESVPQRLCSIVMLSEFGVGNTEISKDRALLPVITDLVEKDHSLLQIFRHVAVLPAVVAGDRQIVEKVSSAKIGTMIAQGMCPENRNAPGFPTTTPKFERLPGGIGGTVATKSRVMPKARVRAGCGSAG
jgi:hypothetical protein